MSDDDIPALPPKTELEDNENHWMKDAELYSRNLLKMAEAVNDTAQDLYDRAVVRRKKDKEEIKDGDLDKEIIHLMMRDLPEAFNEFGNMLEEAREVERYIGKADYITEGSYTPTRAGDDFDEEEFLDRYRQVESEYLDTLHQLGRPVGSETLPVYLEERYDLNLEDALPDMPDPRPDNR